MIKKIMIGIYQKKYLSPLELMGEVAKDCHIK